MSEEDVDDSGYVIKDSGEKATFDSGMVRDTSEGKPDYTRLYDGVMAERVAIHLTLALEKYPDIAPGVPNWTQADSPEEVQRFKVSAARHFKQWLAGETDEDHAAAIWFNVDGAETTKAKIAAERYVGLNLFYGLDLWDPPDPTKVDIDQDRGG